MDLTEVVQAGFIIPIWRMTKVKSESQSDLSKATQLDTDPSHISAGPTMALSFRSRFYNVMTPVSLLHWPPLWSPVGPSPSALEFDSGSQMPTAAWRGRQGGGVLHFLGDTQQRCLWWRAHVTLLSLHPGSLRKWVLFVRLEKMRFSSPFQAKSICLPHKEGSEPVIITHHTLGSVKVTFSNT